MSLFTYDNLKNWRKDKIKACKKFPRHLYYFSSMSNIDNIKKFGILPKNQIVRKNIHSVSIADTKVQEFRKSRKCTISNRVEKSIHDLVPTYLNPKSPTLYARRFLDDDIFFCLINSMKLLSDPDINFAFTDGNAANLNTKFFSNLEKLSELNWDIINGEYWNDKPDGKRIRNAEFLIYPQIKLKYIEYISCKHYKTLDKIRNVVGDKFIKFNVDKTLFF